MLLVNTVFTEVCGIISKKTPAKAVLLRATVMWSLCVVLYYFGLIQR